MEYPSSAIPSTSQTTMQTISLYAIAALFVGAGIGHFLRPSVFAQTVPPYFPCPHLLVYLSGVAEVAGGIGVLNASTRPYAGWGLILFLCVVFPVHIYMLRAPGDFPDMPSWTLYVRVPLQFVLMAWVYWTAVDRSVDRFRHKRT